LDDNYSNSLGLKHTSGSESNIGHDDDDDFVITKKNKVVGGFNANVNVISSPSTTELVPFLNNDNINSTVMDKDELLAAVDNEMVNYYERYKSIVNVSFLPEEEESDGVIVEGLKPSWCLDSHHYVVYSWILCMVSLAAFLKLNFLVKATITVLMAIVYNLLIFIPYKELFLDVFLDDDSSSERSIEIVFFKLCLMEIDLTKMLYLFQRENTNSLQTYYDDHFICHCGSLSL
jgi:hypothetical protein